MNKSIWLFHFRLAGEQLNNSLENAHGLGHAYRCLTLINELEIRHGISSLAVINETRNGEKFLCSKGLEPYFEKDLESLIRKFNIEVIVSDINYLEQKYIDTYSKVSRWVCLAPRGQTKYKSSVSFKDTLFYDEEPSVDPENNVIFSGLDYLVTRPEYLIAKGLPRNKTRTKFKIIISMGGIDHLDLTSTLIEYLKDIGENFIVEVIIGPLYSNQRKLKKTISNSPLEINLVKNPNNIYENLKNSDIGIFASGLVSYESLGLGTPPLNINFSEFHSMRSKEIEALGIGVDLGSVDSLDASTLKEEIINLKNDKKRMNLMREKGMNLVDGAGASRILSKIKETFLI